MLPRVLRSPQEVLEAFTEALPAAASTYKAMYNSRINGITMDPALMVVPLDDHMVHRGHAVFDTLSVVEGRAVHVDEHFQRLQNSAISARIELPMPLSVLRASVLNTVAATGLSNCKVRYWVSAGPGSFQVAPESGMSVLYVVVLESDPRELPAAIKEFSSKIPLKPTLLATMKTTNYLLNALVCMESVEQGGSFGIQTDLNGDITEGSVVNALFVLPGAVLVTAPFNDILTGITIGHVLAYAHELVRTGTLSRVEIRKVNLRELSTCTEMMLSSAECVRSVVEFEGRPIGGGHTGPVTQLIQERIWQELFDTSLSEAVPYENYS